jgi:hypothetical protein
LKTRSRPDIEKPGNEKLNSRFKPEKNRSKPGKGNLLVYFNKSIILGGHLKNISALLISLGL